MFLNLCTDRKLLCASSLCTEWCGRRTARLCKFGSNPSENLHPLRTDRNPDGKIPRPEVHQAEASGMAPSLFA
jgi:hypothetical protein